MLSARCLKYYCAFSAFVPLRLGERHVPAEIEAICGMPSVSNHICPVNPQFGTPRIRQTRRVALVKSSQSTSPPIRPNVRYHLKRINRKDHACSTTSQEAT